MAAKSTPKGDTYSLKSIPENHFSFQFTGIEEFQRITTSFHNQSRAQDQDIYLTFQGVPCDILEHVKLLHSRKTHILDRQILYIKMVSTPHDTAALMFAHFLSEKTGKMGITLDVWPKGSGRAHMGDITKEPDGCWGPAGKRYVTLVLEVGLSQGLEGLLSDADIWFTSENSHVLEVVLVDILQDRPQISIQKWVAPTTNLRTAQQARMTKEIRIKLKNGVPAADGALTLSFEKLLERRPLYKPQERDIKISRNDLGELAKAVWTEQGFISEISDIKHMPMP